MTSTRLFIGGEWVEAASGEAARGHQPGHRRVARRRSRRATGRTRGARSRAAGGLPRLGRGHRVRARRRAPPRRRGVRAPPRRARARAARSTRASRCREAYDEVDELVAMLRGAAEDGIRHRGLHPAQLRRGQARAPDAPAEGAGRRSSRPGTGRTRCPPRSSRPRSPAATRWCGTRRPAPPSAPARSPSASPRPTSRPASSTSCPARARSWETRSSPTPARSPSASSAPRPPAGRSPSEPRARRCCSRWAATARSSSWTTPTSRRPPRPRSPRASCAPGQSCTAGERLLVHEAVRDEFVERLREGAVRAALGDPLDAQTIMGPLNNEPVAEKMDEHVEDAVTRGAEVVAGGSRADGFPTDLYWPATVLDNVPADALASTEETFGPIAPVVAIASPRRGDSADERIALRPARRHLHGRPLQRPPLRRRGAQRPREHQRDHQLLGEPSPLRRPRRNRQRNGPRGRPPSVRGAHRAPDGRHRHTSKSAPRGLARPGRADISSRRE